MHLLLTQATYPVIIIPEIAWFERDLLNQLISILATKATEAPVWLVLGISTSLQHLEELLTSDNLLKLSFSLFQHGNTESLVNAIYKAAYAQDCCVWISPNYFHEIVSKYLLDTPNTALFFSVLQYAFLNHFFLNPLSIFCSDTLEFSNFSSVYAKSMLCSRQFQHYVTKLVEGSQYTKARTFFNVPAYVCNSVPSLKKKMRNNIGDLNAAYYVYTQIQKKCSFAEIPRSEFYHKAFTGVLIDKEFCWLFSQPM